MIETCTFDDILPFWRDKLWPNRSSPIEPRSMMTFPKGYDMTIQRYAPTFFRYRVAEETIGVFSGHRMDAIYYRGRGMWVEPHMRRQNIATMLIAAVCEQAKQEGCHLVWLVPREETWRVYERAGFIRCGEPFNDGMEFGPNVNCVKRVL